MAIIHATNENFEEEVLKASLPVLVDFYADWCGPCKRLAPTIDEIAEELNGKVKVVKVNVDEADKVAANYAVMSIPTLIIFKNGEDVKKAVGVQPKEKIIEDLGL